VQVKAFRLMVNRSVGWAEWDEELLGLELSESKDLDFDLALTGFDTREIDEYLAGPENDEDADTVPPIPDEPASRLGDLWLCGKHRVLCGAATAPEAVTRLCGSATPSVRVTDPRTEFHWISSGVSGLVSTDTALPKPAYVWHASKFTREVLDGLLRIGFLHHQQIIWNKDRTVLTRTHYWLQHEPCWYVRKKNAPWFGKAGENSTVWDIASPKFISGRLQGRGVRPSNPKAAGTDAPPDSQPHEAR
jgi:hypothetical protein